MTRVLILATVGILGACADETPTEALTQSAAGPPAVSLAGFVPGGVVLNSHDGNTIHACAKLQGGALRLASSAEACSPSETAVSWNIQGPQGPPGVAEAHIHSASATSTEGIVGVVAQCEPDEIATGGGFTMSGPALGVALIRDSRPHSTVTVGVPNAWFAAAIKVGPGAELELTLSADVVCVPVGDDE